MVDRVEEFMKERKSKVRIGEEVLEVKEFWTARGVRQFIDSGNEGGNEESQVGKIDGRLKRMYSLGSADDIVLLAEKEGKMRNIMERLERFIKNNLW